MSQSCFSLGFLSQNSLWKLFTFCGYKGIYSGVYEECEKSYFNQIKHSGNSTSRLERVTSLSHELTAWLNWKFFPIVLQLSWPFSSPACFTHVLPLVTCYSRDPVTRLFLSAHILSFLHTLSHLTLT